MILDLTKLDVWFVNTPLTKLVDGKYVYRDLPSYDETKGPILYRAHCENRGDGLNPCVWFSSYPIVGYTPCGVWIGQGIKRKKFVNLKAQRQWATLTKDEAFNHLKHRKRRQLEILSWKLDLCQNINHHLKTGALL